MGKSKRRKRYDETEEERQERLLDQVKMSGRQPTPKPGHFHDTGKRSRKAERARLKDLRYTAQEESLSEEEEEQYILEMEAEFEDQRRREIIVKTIVQDLREVEE